MFVCVYEKQCYESLRHYHGEWFEERPWEMGVLKEASRASGPEQKCTPCKRMYLGRNMQNLRNPD